MQTAVRVSQSVWMIVGGGEQGWSLPWCGARVWVMRIDDVQQQHPCAPVFACAKYYWPLHACLQRALRVIAQHPAFPSPLKWRCDVLPGTDSVFSNRNFYGEKANNHVSAFTGRVNCGSLCEPLADAMHTPRTCKSNHAADTRTYAVLQI